MDQSLFTANRTGEVVRVSGPEWAFVPNPLPPPGWSFPATLWPTLAEAKARLGTLDGIGRTLPNPELLIRPLQDREALRSSSLEGTYATPKDLLLFAMNPREPSSSRDPANTWKEVYNYTVALRQGVSMLEHRPLSLQVIREMHRALLTGVRGQEKSPGEFRRLQVGVGHDRRFVPPPAQYLADLLDNLQTYMNVQSEVDPLVRAFIVHYQFEAIHPFIDGNGRVGRALLALMICQSCGHRMPWLYMSAYFERFRDEYIQRLFRISTHGEWSEWVAFCLNGAILQANDSIRRCELLQSLRRQYAERMVTQRPRTRSIIEDLFRSPVITVPDVARRFDVAYKTAKSDIRCLLDAGVLREIPNHYPAAFYAPGIFEIAFKDATFEQHVGMSPDRPAREAGGINVPHSV